MATVLVTGGTPRRRIAVGTSPLAELAACLHALTEAEHHGARQAWRAEVTESLTPELEGYIERYSPLWAAYRCRVLYPLDAVLDRTLDEELETVSTMPLDRFVALTGYACAGGHTGVEVDHLLVDADRRDHLLAVARAGSEARVRLAIDLLDDPAGFRRRLVDFLGGCRTAFFDRIWEQVKPWMFEACRPLRDRLDAESLPAVVASLSDSAEVRGDPERVVIDKCGDRLVDTRHGLIMVPSWYGWPHLTVKNEPGMAVVIQFAASGRRRVMPRRQIQDRLEALSDPNRMPLCRLIARESLSTLALAQRVGMTKPQVSRHLRKLRETGLVQTERQGRFVYYRLDVEEVARLGSDVLTTLYQ